MHDVTAPGAPNRTHDTENFPTASLILAKPVPWRFPDRSSIRLPVNQR